MARKKKESPSQAHLNRLQVPTGEPPPVSEASDDDDLDFSEFLPLKDPKDVIDAADAKGVLDPLVPPNPLDNVRPLRPLSPSQAQPLASMSGHPPMPRSKTPRTPADLDAIAARDSISAAMGDAAGQVIAKVHRENPERLGSWLFLENLELSPSEMPRLEDKIKEHWPPEAFNTKFRVEFAHTDSSGTVVPLRRYPGRTLTIPGKFGERPNPNTYGTPAMAMPPGHGSWQPPGQTPWNMNGVNGSSEKAEIKELRLKAEQAERERTRAEHKAEMEKLEAKQQAEASSTQAKLERIAEKLNESPKKDNSEGIALIAAAITGLGSTVAAMLQSSAESRKAEAERLRIEAQERQAQMKADAEARANEMKLQAEMKAAEIKAQSERDIAHMTVAAKQQEENTKLLVALFSKEDKTAAITAQLLGSMGDMMNNNGRVQAGLLQMYAEATNSGSFLQDIGHQLVQIAPDILGNLKGDNNDDENADTQTGDPAATGDPALNQPTGDPALPAGDPATAQAKQPPAETKNPDEVTLKQIVEAPTLDPPLLEAIGGDTGLKGLRAVHDAIRENNSEGATRAAILWLFYVKEAKPEGNPYLEMIEQNQLVEAVKDVIEGFQVSEDFVDSCLAMVGTVTQQLIKATEGTAS